MNKQDLISKWGYYFNDYFIADLDALIATEIAKVKEQPQPALNPIEQAYHAFQPIRPKSWPKDEWVKKQGETESIDNKGRLWGSNWNFDTNPEEWELYTEPEQVAEPEQPALNPIEQSYERGDKIRKKTWEKDAWIQKHTEIMAIHDDACLRKKVWYNFDTYPNLWELYTEHTEQPAKPFDRERFEAMFRAVVASGDCESSMLFECTKSLIQQLDAYYASKNN